MNASFTIDDQPHVLHEADSLETQNTSYRCSKVYMKEKG